MAENVIKLFQFAPPGAPSVWVQSAYHASVDRHSHEFYELVYIRDGFCLHDVEGRMTLVTEGDMFIIPPGTRHRYVGNRMVNLYNCLFLPDALPEAQAANFERLFGGEDGYPRVHLTLNERKSVGRLLESMQGECARRQLGWYDKLTGLFASLAVDFVRLCEAYMSGGGERAAYSAYVSRALDFIDANYAGDISVAMVAEAAGVSPDYLTRQFRMVTGVTPVEYVRRYRFARAMELLQSGESVTDAAEKVGFHNLCHFSREFKKAMGMTPTQFKSGDREGGNI